MELEREKNDVLIIAHDSILRCLYAYLFDRPDNVSDPNKTLFLFNSYYIIGNPNNPHA